ncbi:MAG: hypothetical protein Q9191_007804 [Dirinaria sp. TL-2023a]
MPCGRQRQDWKKVLLFKYQESMAHAEVILVIKLLGILLVAQNAWILAKRYFENRRDTEIGKRYGCQPPPQLPNRWPLGIDRLKELWHWNSEGHLLAYLCGLADGYEPRNNLFQFMLFGPRVYHTLDPKNVETVLSTDFEKFGFGARRGVFLPLLGDGIFTQEGAAWRHSRELLRKQFARTQYQNLDHFREHVDSLIDSLPTPHGVVDLQPLFFNLTLDTTTALLLGRSVHSLKGESGSTNTAFQENFNRAQEGLAKRFRIAPWQSLYNPTKFRSACADVHHFVDDYISDWNVRRKTGVEQSSSYSFIDELTRASSGPQAIRDQLLNILLAGRDSTACLRLYPPVPLNNRTALQTTVLPRGGGPDGSSPILVRRGEVVSFSPYVNSRRKNIYGPDADEFRPERWESGSTPEIGWAYFPFNGGPRACLGQDFALSEIYYTTVRLLQKFPLMKLPVSEKDEPTGTEKQRLTLVLSSTNGCVVELGMLIRLCPESALTKGRNPKRVKNKFRTLIKFTLPKRPTLIASFLLDGFSHGRQYMSDFGIQELYCPLTDIQVDIVAVHGINGDAHHTWTATGSNICWLSHPAFLPHYIKNARILTWGYNANVISRKGRSTSADRILQHAQTLVAQLHADRELEDARERPIIFRVVSLTVPRKVLETDSSLLKALEEDSEILQNITDQFAPLLHRFRIFFFWEQERTDLTYTKDYVVDQSSAAPIIDGTERSGIAADHQRICRFERKDSPGFRTVAAALKRYCQHAPEVIKARQKSASETLSTRRWNEASELLLDGCVQAVVEGSAPIRDAADRRLQSSGGDPGSLADHVDGRIQPLGQTSEVFSDSVVQSASMSS